MVLKKAAFTFKRSWTACDLIVCGRLNSSANTERRKLGGLPSAGHRKHVLDTLLLTILHSQKWLVKTLTACRNGILIFGIAEADSSSRFAAAKHAHISSEPDQDHSPGHERSLTQIKFNREGDLLFTCSKDSIINVWYAHNGERLGTYDGHNGAVWTIDVDCTSFSFLLGPALAHRMVNSALLCTSLILCLLHRLTSPL